MKNPNIFYVYVLFRPWNGQPFYVGKGKGKRCKTHKTFGNKHRNKHIAHVFEKAAKLSLEVPVVKVREDMSELEAFETEKALISAIGRDDIGLGPLANLTDGGDGPTGRRATEAQKKANGILKKQFFEKNEWAREKVRAKTLKQFSSPEAREHARENTLLQFSDPIKRSRHKAAFATPESKALRKELYSRICNTPEFRKMRSEIAKLTWSDPIKRANRMKGLMKAASDPEVIRRRSKPRSEEAKKNLKAAAQRRVEKVRLLKDN